MEYRRLGHSGLLVSAVGLGTNNFGGRADEQQSLRVLGQALDLGVNFIDTANVYAGTLSEQIIGKGLTGKRDRALIATKFGWPMGKGPNQRGGSRKHILEAAEASLRRLQTDYIDLYQMHQPDPETPIEETLRALDDLIHQGKVRYVGTSNFAGWQISQAHWVARSLNLHSFISEQPHYNLLRRQAEKEVVPACKACGVGLIPWFPLASGMLTGKYREGEPPPPGTRLAQMPQVQQTAFTERNFQIVEKLQRFAQERDHTIGELAIGWLLANPVVGTVIAGAMKPEQVVENARAADWKLTPEELKAIDEMAPAA